MAKKVPTITESENDICQEDQKSNDQKNNFDVSRKMLGCILFDSIRKEKCYYSLRRICMAGEIFAR
jgi:hypothetical protein